MDNRFLVPNVILMIASPSVLAMLMLLTPKWNWTSVELAWGLAAILLMTAPFLYKTPRERGLRDIERLMGMLLVLIVVQMLINVFKYPYSIIEIKTCLP